MKLVGLISDTHIPTRARTIPEKALEAFRGADLIIHAGDLVQLSALSALEELASIVAVCGNMDEHDVRQRLPKMNSVKIYDWKVGVVHDSGALWGTNEKNREAKRVQRASFWSHPPTFPPARRRNLVHQPWKPDKPSAPVLDPTHHRVVKNHRRKN